MVKLGEAVVILDLHRHGLSVSPIARRVGIDRKTVRKYIKRGLEPPVYQARPPRPSVVEKFQPYLRDRVAAYLELTGARLLREIRELGYEGGYTVVKEALRDLRPFMPAPYEVKFETPPGRQAQVGFAHFRTVFADDFRGGRGSCGYGGDLWWNGVDQRWCEFGHDLVLHVAVLELPFVISLEQHGANQAGDRALVGLLSCIEN